ncbi:universal stress protein [Natronorubrum thiooxidans]|uniref:Nucleotide-binding universal stress protein, UspA family n=1 Tax=Natronorubrum thiooxidans TaxID=308853 RepID=A0A1N7H764_9EURY|nr:universal stress protein [Natronorubrum thiooxidans]SIS20641.1 Nucleotide-binding universal stress protein, UspA family [Natronorubrum thiooxidans]
MYHILVPVDEHVDRARMESSYLQSLPIDRASTQITVAHAYENEPRDDHPVERPEAVRTVIDELEAAGFSVEHRELSGPPSEGIVSLATELEADEIVMAGRKRAPTAKVVFGSVTQSVILSNDCPVTVVGVSDA